MKTDEILQQEVTNALNWEPYLATCNITVTSTNGVISLVGKVDVSKRKIA